MENKFAESCYKLLENVYKFKFRYRKTRDLIPPTETLVLDKELRGLLYYLL
jgi:hypothetical protein